MMAVPHDRMLLPFAGPPPPEAQVEISNYVLQQLHVWGGEQDQTEIAYVTKDVYPTLYLVDLPGTAAVDGHGISAAAGKAGAIIGWFGFLYAAQSTDPKKTDSGYPPGIGVRNSLFVLAGCNVVGFFFTFLVPESKGKSLEELSGQNEDLEPEPSVAAEYRSIPPA